MLNSSIYISLGAGPTTQYNMDVLNAIKPKHGGKLLVRGGKQVVRENIETHDFYRNMVVTALVFQALVFYFWWQTYTLSDLFLVGLSLALLAGNYAFMRFMIRPTYNHLGDLTDPGADMYLTGGTAEYVKDLFILVCGTMVLAAVYSWFWLLLLFIPVRVGYSTWVLAIQPWLFPDRPEQEPEVDEKKQRKLERRAKRMEKMR